MIIVNECLVIAFLESNPMPKEVGGDSYMLSCRELTERRGVAYTELFSHQGIKEFVMGDMIASKKMTYLGINIMNGKTSPRLARSRRGRNGVKSTINASQYWCSKAK